MVPYETPEDYTTKPRYYIIFYVNIPLFLDDHTSRGACSQSTRRTPAANKTEHVAADELDVMAEAYASRECVILLQHRERERNRDDHGMSGMWSALRESR